MRDEQFSTNHECRMWNGRRFETGVDLELTIVIVSIICYLIILLLISYLSLVDIGAGIEIHHRYR